MDAFQFGRLIAEKMAAGPVMAERPIMTGADPNFSKAVPHPTGYGGIYDAISQQYPLRGSPATIMANVGKQRASRAAYEAPAGPLRDAATLSQPLYPNGGVYHSNSAGGNRRLIPPYSMAGRDRELFESLPKLPAGQAAPPTFQSPPRGTGMGAQPR